MIYKVVSTEMLSLRERSLRDPDEDAYLNLVRNVLKSGPMYFSYGFDLTSSFQRQSKSNAREPLWKRADDRFFWNKFISTDLIDFASGESGSRLHSGAQNGADSFILPVICGMLELKRTSIKGNPLT